jgi:hypothetical protein
MRAGRTSENKKCKMSGVKERRKCALLYNSVVFR